MSINSMLKDAANAVKGISAPPSPDYQNQAPKVVVLLRDAEAALAGHVAQYDALALASFNGEAGAASKLEAYEKQRVLLATNIERLQAVHRAALDADARYVRQAHEAIRQGQLQAVTSHLRARDRAAEDLVRIIGKAVNAWGELVVRSRKAAAANPIGSTWPSGSLCDAGLLDSLVREEMFRLGGTERDGRLSKGKVPSFPGAETHNQRLVDNPRAVPPLLERLHEATEGTLAILRGDVRQHKPVVTTPEAQEEWRAEAQPEADAGEVAEAIPAGPTHTAEEVMATIKPVHMGTLRRGVKVGE